MLCFLLLQSTAGVILFLLHFCVYFYICVYIFGTLIIVIYSPFAFSAPFLESPQVAILDFGSQYSHLIARRVRELHVYCELYSCLVQARELAEHDIIAIIFSGGPNSVYEEGAPHVSPQVWDLIDRKQIPVLGICYGMQEMAHVLGGAVEKGLKHEYGKSMVRRVEGCNSILFQEMPTEFQMWMSHGDKLSKVPTGFKPVGKYLLIFEKQSTLFLRHESAAYTLTVEHF